MRILDFALKSHFKVRYFPNTGDTDPTLTYIKPLKTVNESCDSSWCYCFCKCCWWCAAITLAVILSAYDLLLAFLFEQAFMKLKSNLTLLMHTTCACHILNYYMNVSNMSIIHLLYVLHNLSNVAGHAVRLSMVTCDIYA